MNEQISILLNSIKSGLGENANAVSVCYLVLVLLFCFAIYWLSQKVLINIIHKFSVKSKTTFDDKLIETNFFEKISVVVPLFILYNSITDIFIERVEIHSYVLKFIEILLIVNFGAVLFALINALQKMLWEKPQFKDKPLNSYAQLLKIIIYLVLGITLFSILTGKTPLFFLTAMGAMSAIVLLIFKDTILGFVGSIQLATNDMVRIGDWITMEKYGADGNVEEINLATIKVQNFDLTITTIPTYSLISDSFKNWRGMEESDGRRIKRAINIKISSVHFIDQKALQRFKEIKLLQSYLEEKEKELSVYNEKHHLSPNEINERRLTNVGVFRKYVEIYLKNHYLLNTNLTCMVRQLPPTEKGLPIEVYAFSKNKEWVKYENVMSDIFDHLLAVIPSFGLEVFQSPTGSDFVGVHIKNDNSDTSQK